MQLKWCTYLGFKIEVEKNVRSFDVSMNNTGVTCKVGDMDLREILLETDLINHLQSS